MTGGWLLLLALAQEGVWLAFPLFFVQLRLLSLRWSLPAGALTTLTAITGFGWHKHTLSVGTVMSRTAAVAAATAEGIIRR